MSQHDSPADRKAIALQRAEDHIDLAILDLVEEFDEGQALMILLSLLQNAAAPRFALQSARPASAEVH